MIDKYTITGSHEPPPEVKAIILMASSNIAFHMIKIKFGSVITAQTDNDHTLHIPNGP